jgi:hypothetical protein
MLKVVYGRLHVLVSRLFRVHYYFPHPLPPFGLLILTRILFAKVHRLAEVLKAVIRTIEVLQSALDFFIRHNIKKLAVSAFENEGSVRLQNRPDFRFLYGKTNLFVGSLGTCPLKDIAQ